MSMIEQWTPSGVRLRRRHERTGDVDWLLLPGGPGIGSHFAWIEEPHRVDAAFAEFARRLTP